MGRKPILPSQRAQPISFSLKPHLIEKIDDYAADLRFSRSKFLQQAVTEYMTRHIVNPNNTDLSSNVDDMSLDRRVAVGLAALQEANREGVTIRKGVMDALRRELNMMIDDDDEEFDTDREVGGIVYRLFKPYESKAAAQREVAFHQSTHYARVLKIQGGQFEGQWGAYVSRVEKGE